MSADDGPTAGSPDLGDALVAALGFEPTDGSGEVALASTVVAEHDAAGESPFSGDPVGPGSDYGTDPSPDHSPSAEGDESTMSPPKGKGPKSFGPLPDTATEVDDGPESGGQGTVEADIRGNGSNGDTLPVSVGFEITGETPSVSLIDTASSGVKPVPPTIEVAGPLAKNQGSAVPLGSGPPIQVSPVAEAPPTQPAGPIAVPLVGDPSVQPPGPGVPLVMDPAGQAVVDGGAAFRQSSQGDRVVNRMGELAARVPQLLDSGLLHRSRRVRARKVRRVVRHIDPWSVLTFSVLFHLCVFAALLLSSVLVWNAALAAGTIEKVESFIRELGDYTTYEIKGDVVFRAAMVIAGILTLASSVLTVLLTVVFNLISDLVGGIRVTVIEEETVRVRRKRKQ